MRKYALRNVIAQMNDCQLQVDSSCSEKPLRRALAATVDAGAQYADSSHVIDVIRMDLEDRGGGTCICSSEKTH